MESLPGLSFWQTVLIAIVVPMFVSHYLEPYKDFRRELIKTKLHLKLHSNIYSSFWVNGEISDTFKTEIIETQKELRIIWAHLEIKYLLIPLPVRWLLTIRPPHLFPIKKLPRWFPIKPLPKSEELDNILKDILAISNSSVIYPSKKQKEDDGRTEASERRKEKDKVLMFVKKYI